MCVNLKTNVKSVKEETTLYYFELMNGYIYHKKSPLLYIPKQEPRTILVFHSAKKILYLRFRHFVTNVHLNLYRSFIPNYFVSK